VALVGIVDHGDGVVPHGVTDAVNPGNQDKPTWNALALRHRHGLLALENNKGT
jgi:hypothetical protein